MTTLILVRHAETTANVSKLWYGAMDSPLTARGELQLEATALRVRELAQTYGLDAFYVSPLPRARSTADALGRAMGRTALTEEDLREFDLGDWEGRSFEDLRDQEDLWGRWKVDPGFAPPNGESPTSFNRRAETVIQRIVQRHPEQCILVVTHGGVICNVLANWLGKGPADWRNWEGHNCAVSVLESDGDGWRGLVVNDVSHLPVTALSDVETSAAYAD
jgi:probable phosphoglycerate mutase